MNYGLLESGALPNNIPGALRQHFRYDQDVTHESVDANRMVEEIRWQRPVLLGGRSADGGHRWVVYGYNQGINPWQFNMNMGWGGGSDGQYSFDNIPSGLTNSLNQVIRIAPRNVVGFVGGSGSGDGSPDSPYRDIEEAISNAADHTTLIFKADSFNTFSASQLAVNKPLILKGINSTLGK